MMKYVFIAILFGVCMGVIGGYLEANKLIVSPAFWTLYGFVFGVGEMLVMVTILELERGI